jgi:hypothetical protein
MVLVADQLKRKPIETGLQIEELRKQIVALTQRQAAFDVVIQARRPEYSPASDSHIVRPAVRGGGVDPDGVSELFKGFDRHSFVLRTLREAGRSITTAECALAFALESGIGGAPRPGRPDRKPLLPDARPACEDKPHPASRKGRRQSSPLGGDGVAARVLAGQVGRMQPC